MHGDYRSGSVAWPGGGVGALETAPAARAGRGESSIPYWMILLFLVSMYGVVAETVPALAAARPAMTTGVGALAFLIVERLVARRPLRLPWPEGYALMAFFGAAALSAPNALWPGLAVESTIELSKLLVIYVLLANVVNTRAKLRGLVATMVIAGLMPARGTIENYLAGNVVDGSRAAWIGRFSGPNELAFELTILVPLALALMVPARWWGRVLLSGAVATYLAAIFFTFSRSGLLGLAAMVGVATLRMRSAAAKVAIVVCAIAAVAVGSQFWERDQDFDLAGDATYNQRWVTVQAGMAMFYDNPVFGVGIGCSEIGWETYSPDTLIASKWLTIHNTFVQALAETGIVGFTFLMLAIFSSTWQAHRIGGDERVSGEIRAYATAVELAFIALLISGLANGFVEIAAPYLLIGLASAITGLAAMDRQSEGR